MHGDDIDRYQALLVSNDAKRISITNIRCL